MCLLTHAETWDICDFGLLILFMSTGRDCFIGGTAGDLKSSADEGWVHLEELRDEYI